MKYEDFKNRVKNQMSLTDFAGYIDIHKNSISKWKYSGVPQIAIRALESIEYKKELFKCQKKLLDLGGTI